MRWLDTGDTVIRHEITGEGPPLVLVHEMGGSLNSWDAVAPALARHYRVLRYDLRGAGQSEKVRAPLSMDILAADLVALLDAAGIAGPAAFLGTAVGAALTMRLARVQPRRVACLVALSPVTACPAARQQSVLAHADRIEKEGLRALEAASIDGILPPPLRQDPVAHEQARCRWLANDPHSFAAIYRMFAHLEMAEEYPRIACPALLVGATHDGLRPPAAVQAVAAAMPNARYEEWPTGHIAAVQTPEMVVRGTLDFLREHLPPS